MASQAPEPAFDVDLKLGRFGAFYTKLNSGEAFEEYSRTGDFADIVVDLGKEDALFVFWRGTGYLPYLQIKDRKWPVPEVIERKGDGTEQMPDRVNCYSVVKIIDQGPDQAVIHWRYLPEFTGGNPHAGAAGDRFVDEYFTIKPDGSVTRTIRKGTLRVDEWANPENKITQTFILTPGGIENIRTEYPEAAAAATTPVEGNPIVAAAAAEPVAWWKFDEARGSSTAESVSQTRSEIAGSKSLWRKGVSGTALQFDGYYSAVRLPAEKAPKLRDAVTLEGWVALGAYPWSYAPIVQQSSDEPEVIERVEREHWKDPKQQFKYVSKEENDTGYFLGLDGYGRPAFKIRVGDKWEELLAENILERRTWYHLAATYDQSTGLMSLYVDGEKVAGKKAARPASIELSDKDLIIGKGKDRKPIRPVRKNTFADSYSMDGLIDEVRIYDVALTSDQILKNHREYVKNQDRFSSVDMDKRVLPSGENRRKFGAYYTHLKFYDVWDNLWRFSAHPDVVVEFDRSPVKFIFWRGTCYIPMIVNEKGQWYSNEFNETWNKSGGKGCQEPMSDKESFSNHARIIENTPARTVVHWRYPLIDVNRVMANYDETTGWCDWSDWYYYIYPDGVAVKTKRLWTHGERNHEWQESMAIFGPDQHPEQIIHTTNALTMLNLQGDRVDYDWITGPPPNVKEPEGQCIQYVNYTGQYKPITIGDFERSNVYRGEVTDYAVFPTWNHWPVAQMPSDGRYAIYPDRTAHSSLTHVFPSIYREVLDGPKPYYEKLLMEGMLDLEPEQLVPLAKSWLQPAEIEALIGAAGSYDPAQRAYVLNKEADTISLKLDASADHPIYNLTFVIRNWGSEQAAGILINGRQRPSGPDLRQGTLRDTDGTLTQIIWIEIQITRPVEVRILQ